MGQRGEQNTCWCFSFFLFLFPFLFCLRDNRGGISLFKCLLLCHEVGKKIFKTWGGLERKGVREEVRLNNHFVNVAHRQERNQIPVAAGVFFSFSFFFPFSFGSELAAVIISSFLKGKSPSWSAMNSSTRSSKRDMVVMEEVFSLVLCFSFLPFLSSFLFENLREDERTNTKKSEQKTVGETNTAP